MLRPRHRRERVAPAAHNMTNFQRWFEATEPYSIQYATDFEPWFLAARNRTQASRAWKGLLWVRLSQCAAGVD